MTTFPGGIFGNNMIAQPEIDARGPEYQNDATARNPIGGKIRWNNKILRYVRFDNGTGNVTPSAGGPAWGKTITPAATATAQPIFTVTADQTDSVFGQTPVGAFLQFTTAPTDLYYIWIGIGGIHQCLVPAAVEEDMVIGSSTDNQFGRIAAGSNLTRPMVGIRMEGSSSSGLSPVLLTNMDW